MLPRRAKFWIDWKSPNTDYALRNFAFALYRNSKEGTLTNMVNTLCEYIKKVSTGPSKRSTPNTCGYVMAVIGRVIKFNVSFFLDI